MSGPVVLYGYLPESMNPCRLKYENWSLSQPMLRGKGSGEQAPVSVRRSRPARAGVLPGSRRL